MVTWSIVQLDRNATDGFVTSAHWTAVEVDGEFRASSYGSVGFSGDLVTPYENLTQEQVLEWVWNEVDKAEVESILASEIAAQKIPATVTGVPW